MAEVSLNIKKASSGGQIDVVETVLVSMDDSELEDLREFQNEAERLEAYPSIKKGLQVSFNISGNIGEGVKFTATPPDVVQIDATLHRARPFLLNNERVSFSKIRSIVARSLRDSEHASSRLKKLKKKFLCTNDGERMTISNKEGKVINSERNFERWINTREYHRDSIKKLELEADFRSLPKPLVDNLFYSVFVDKLDAIFELKSIIDELLKAFDERH